MVRATRPLLHQHLLSALTLKYVLQAALRCDVAAQAKHCLAHAITRIETEVPWVDPLSVRSRSTMPDLGITVMTLLVRAHGHTRLQSVMLRVLTAVLTLLVCARGQIMASEVGVVDVPDEDVETKGRLMPGNIFLVDFEAKRVVRDEEVQHPSSLSPCACTSRTRDVALVQILLLRKDY